MAEVKETPKDEFLNEVIAAVFHLKKLLASKLILPPDLLQTLEEIKYFALSEYGKTSKTKKV